jgi:hypothetical protein
MLTLLRSLRSRPVYLSEPVSFFTALIIAEIFYKFHSFLLETGAFLVTWLMLAKLVDAVVKWIDPKPSASRH